MRHHSAVAWEKRLKKVFDEIDHEIEGRYTGYSLHPSRARSGSTSNREHDGLFGVGAAFSAGFGSRHGRGYVVEVRFATPDAVPSDVRREIEDFVAGRLREKLPVAFPGRKLSVDRDGASYKIHGDLSLGTVHGEPG
ncbi:MAG: hypothetical protein FJ224_09520 [Lentisphaerae bacterium]|nr:hypothetical protein [Lentisphaerota bacterium]